jgi:hypothetical protein
MKTNWFTLAMILWVPLFVQAGPIDGFWQCTSNNTRLEVIPTSGGIKVRVIENGNYPWNFFNASGQSKFIDDRGYYYLLKEDRLEFYGRDRNLPIIYLRDGNVEGNGWNPRGNQPSFDRDPRRDWTDRNGDRRERESWNSYYRNYEGRWHNHSTGERIAVDLSRRSLRIKFRGERWFEVFEYQRGLFRDRRGNEFAFRRNEIEYRSSDQDLIMRFFNEDQCRHDHDFRADYWR